MITTLVPVGNSVGVRLPKKLLRSSKVRDRVDLSVDKKGRIIITPKPDMDEIEAGYAAMAADEEREKEAMAWCEGMMSGLDLPDEDWDVFFGKK